MLLLLSCTAAITSLSNSVRFITFLFSEWHNSTGLPVNRFGKNPVSQIDFFFHMEQDIQQDIQVYFAIFTGILLGINKTLLDIQSRNSNFTGFPESLALYSHSFHVGLLVFPDPSENY